ncbi:hypothetical protein SCHPADRAFT_475659 [Schizopora paradoxa]|uniref:Chromatin elongation factor SPT5 n=1 Tax=Schizopora paradoxa TaxID=27342 RepID=A0A0H2RHM3_9AGAM|nr:hypothetical protein SCHPADRAFT_475659 [Schizopora paradoxa]
MRNRHAASRFLDLVAGVDDEDDSEEGDELDELDVDEEEDLEEADLRPPAPNAFDDHGGDAAAELDEAFDALLKRSKERGAEDPASIPPIEGRGGYTERDCATSVLRRQVDVPGPEDVPMYSIQVKRGKDQLLAFRLTNKALKTNATDILSILALPKKAPGRIYVEARNGSASVRLLCSGMHFIYPNSIFMVPVSERVALLLSQPTSSRPPSFKRGDLVKIRNGVYRDDLGEVVDVSDGYDTLVVKVKGREPDPRELKRKRGKNSVRREPSVYDKEELRRLHFFNGDFDFIDLGEDAGFNFGGKHYTNDGYLVLKIRRDRVERLGVHRTMVDQLEAQARLSDEDLSRTSNGTLTSHRKMSSHPEARLSLCCSSSDDLPRSLALASSIPPPKFIRPGVRVRITAGASAGAVARVIDVKSSPPYTALVQLQRQPTRPKNPRPSSLQEQNSKMTPPIMMPPIKFDIELAYLTRVYEIGDHVEVKVGEMRGRVGMVTMVTCVEGEVVHVVDSKELLEFQVPASFIDTYEPPFVRRLAPADAPIYHLGSPVKITRGKNAGKTGRVVMIQRERECVTVLEDVTDIEDYLDSWL